MTTTTFEVLSGAADGFIAGQASNLVAATAFATARATSTLCTVSNLNTWVGIDYGYSKGMYTFIVYRSFLCFDTSAIPDGDPITSVKLRLKAQNDYSTTDFVLQVVQYTWSAPLCDTREANYDGALAAGAVVGTYDTSGGWTADTWYEIDLTPTSIVSKTSTTYLVLRSKEDADNSLPTADEFVTFHNYQTDPADAAELVVVHGAAVSTFKQARALLGVGW